MTQYYNMTDRELRKHLAHHEDDDALDELCTREACKADSRVAQALGRATGRENEPS